MNHQIEQTTFDADVIISGLGPTGLTLAHLLVQRGIKVLILEREPIFYGNARAVYTDDECMRIFQQAGVAEELSKDMLVDMPVQFVHGNGEPFMQYIPKVKRYGWPVVNFFYQPYLETHLTKSLLEFKNVTILRGRELIEFNQDKKGVTVTHAKSTGTGYGNLTTESQIDKNDSAQVRGKYLVACDGGRSTIRTKLGIELTGKSYPEPWLVVDIKQKDGEQALRHIPYFNFYCDPDLPTVSCPQPDGYHRFEFMLQPGQTKEYMEKPETVRMLLSRHVDPDRFEVKRRLVYTFNALVADEWRRDRILLAGDAAHMTPQFIGQGMSAGVRDAHNLGWKLEAILKGNAKESLLDSYQSERSHHAREMITNAIRVKNAVSVSQPAAVALRNLVLNTISVVKPLKTYLTETGLKAQPIFKPGAYFGLERTRTKGVEGTLMPQPEVADLEGRHLLLDDALGGGFALMGQSVNPQDYLAQDSQTYLQNLGVKFATLYDNGNRPQGTEGISRAELPGTKELEDFNNNMQSWFKAAGFRSNAIVILRPDKYVYAIVNRNDLDQTIQQLKADLGAGTQAAKSKNKRTLKLAS